MSDYPKTRKVLTRLRIEVFELFDLCKKGKLQAYNIYGKKIVDPDLCEKGKKDSLDNFRRLVNVEEGTNATGHVVGFGSPRTIEKPLTKEEQERKARKQYNAQPDTPIIPEDCVPFNFSFPARPSKFQTSRQVQNISKQKIKEAETFRFKESDVKKLEIERGIKDKPLPKSKQFENLTASKKDHKFSDYQHLDLTELKVMAHGWANRFSVIKQITLYRADSDGKYVLDVRIDDSDKIEYRSFEECWIDKACYLDRLRDAYITPNTDYYGDWLFRLPEVGGEPLSKDDQILTDSRFVLFPRDDVDADNKSIPEKTLPFFPCETGTKWEDIKITLTGNDTVRIKTPQGEGLFSYHELKMSDKRVADKPKIIWPLFKFFAKNNGRVSSQNFEYNPKLPDTAKRLNKHLKELFGINESIYKHHYKKTKGYETKIFFSDQTKVVS